MVLFLTSLICPSSSNVKPLQPVKSTNMPNIHGVLLYLVESGWYIVSWALEIRQNITGKHNWYVRRERDSKNNQNIRQDPKSYYSIMPYGVRPSEKDLERTAWKFCLIRLIIQPLLHQTTICSNRYRMQSLEYTFLQFKASKIG